ncbi:ANTAR domain-containing protein [Solihabitans fulvus]|uniref:ANTAR domain-containing protein n=1 Tax=Solihabitans fulvus TaxID=1892852 RepID=UPI001662144C|nr:ANTAR domain-containing protein [Solihabitans fulvus]
MVEQQGAEQLAETVARLREELAGMREGQRGRAIIEQAKGVLATALGVTPEAAFDHLRTLSRAGDRKVGELAAQLVSAVAPEPDPVAVAELPPATAELLRSVRRGQPRPGSSAVRGVVSHLVRHHRRGEEAGASAEDRAALRLAVERVRAAADPADLLAAFRAGSAWPTEATTDLLYLLEPDGALRLLAGHGLEPGVLSAWRRIPTSLEMPLTVVARFGLPLFYDDQDSAVAAYPQTQQLGEPPHALAVLPLIRDDRVTGALRLGWPQPHPFTARDRRCLGALADAVAGWVADHGTDTAASTAGPPAPDAVLEPPTSALTIVVETSLDPMLVLTPRRGRDGRSEVTDFRIDYGNRAVVDADGRTIEEIVGRSLLELYPSMAGGRVFNALVDVVRHNRLADIDHLTPDPILDASPLAGRTYRMRAARLWDAVLVTWHPVSRPAPWSDHTENEELLRSAEKEDVGLWVFHPASGTLLGNRVLSTILGSDPGGAPVKPEELLVLLDPRDRSRARREFQDAVTRGNQLSTVLRLASGPARRRLHVTARPEFDRDGNLVLLRGSSRPLGD